VHSPHPQSNSAWDDFRTTLLLPAAVPMVKEQAKQHQVIAGAAGGAAIAGFGDIAYAVLRYVTNVAMTHLLPQSVYGIFVTVYASVIIISDVAGLGLDRVILRFLPVYRAKGETGLATGLIRFVVWVTLISGFLGGTLFFLFAAPLARFVYHVDTYELPIREAALLIPLIALQLVLASGLMALKAVKWKVYVDRVIQPILTIVFMGVFYLLGLRLEAAILASACGFLAAVIIGQFLLGKASKELVGATKPQFEPKTWLCFALPMAFNSLMQNALNSTDVLFLAVLATPAQVGLYGAAERLSFFVVMPLLALNTIFSPLAAEYYARREHEQLANMFKLVTKWSFSLSLPVFLCLCTFQGAILNIFGREYTAGGVLVIILSLGNLVDAGVGSVGYLLLMTGRPRVILANTAVTVVINLALVGLLVPHFNVIGAAIAAALAVIILNLVSLVEVYWILKMHPYRWDILKPIAAGSVASGVGLLLLQIVPVDDGPLVVLEILGLIVPFMLVYVLVLALLRFSEEDKMVFAMVRAKLSGKAFV
jgi:O-antigen/teichoic acid export membrane protein